MRDFRAQTLVNCLKIIFEKKLGLGELLRYAWLWIRPVPSKQISTNKIFDRRDISILRPLLLKLAKKDPAWFPRLFEPTTLGIRAWEYGLLLSKSTFRHKTVLDVGPGNSRLPRYLSKAGAKVTMLDMDQPLEETEIKKDKNLRFVLGDMTKMELRSNSFDIVICISAIEHVDMKGEGKFFQKDEYFKRAMRSIREMSRVTKKGGVFYLTTDFYLPLQKSDKWSGSVDRIRGAFPWEYLERFTKEIQKCGIKLSSTPLFDKSIILQDPQRAIYRGRYFSTFAFMGKKI